MMEPQVSPEQVRQRWDALLNVINGPAQQDEQQQPSSSQPARDLLAQSGGPLGASSCSGAMLGASSSQQRQPQPRRKDWDDRHHLLFSVVNDKMQKNVRAYFDRPREAESYGLKLGAQLRTTWQLETPVEPPSPGASSRMATPKHGTSGTGHGKSLMSKSASSPDMFNRSQWDSRHHVMFTKDNKTYHPNSREYFERPKDLLY